MASAFCDGFIYNAEPTAQRPGKADATEGLNKNSGGLFRVSSTRLL